MQQKTLRTIGASVVLLGVAVAGFAQAGSADEQPPSDIVAQDSSTTRATGPADTDAAPSSTTSEPFVYRMGVLSGISTDNFWAYYGEEPSVWNSYVLGPTKSALYTLDPATGTLSAELAADDVTPSRHSEGWQVTVPIDDRFAWSDGTPITASDFVFTFETVRALDLGGSWADAYPAIVESLHAADDHTLRIEFEERPVLSVWPHGVGLAPVMARHVWADIVSGITADDLYAVSGDVDVSGGPLTLTTATESHVVSIANSGYPDAGMPETVEYHIYEDEEALVSAIAEGAIDSVLTPKGITNESLVAVQDEDTVARVTSPANGVRYLGFNLTREPMSAPEFRQALALLVDREQLAEEVAHTGDVALAMIPPANGQWYDETAARENHSRYGGELVDRLETALEGLRGAGYEWATEPAISEDGSLAAGEGLTIDGRPAQPLTILTPGDEYDTARPEYVQRIADTLDVLGFDTRPVETDFDTVVDLAFTPGEDGELRYDMYMLGWTLGNPALPDFYRHLFASDGGMNNTGYASTEFERLLADYEQAHTAEQAREALWGMEEMLATDLPYLVLYTSELTEIYRSDRVAFTIAESLGGFQGRLGGIGDVTPVDG